MEHSSLIPPVVVLLEGVRACSGRRVMGTSCTRSQHPKWSLVRKPGLGMVGRMMVAIVVMVVIAMTLVVMVVILRSMVILVVPVVLVTVMVVVVRKVA